MAERDTDGHDNTTEVHNSSEISSGGDEGTIKDEETKADSIPDCPVCLQTCSYPVKLACGHIFCFLCIKGVVFRSKRCALCRQDVDLDYFKNPVVVKSCETKNHEEILSGQSLETSDRYQWYYEGRNGWWQYDNSSSTELEKAHKESKRSCELLIAGFLYFIDFENMVQFRKTEPGRRRRIKRDVIDAEKKGVAGLRIEGGSRVPVVPDVHVESFNQEDNRNCSPPTSDNPPESLDRLVIGSSSDDESSVQQNKNSSS